MDLSKFNNWLQIAANVGIVVGLLLVGVQLKQNSDLLKTQLLYEESERATRLETLVVGEDGARVWAKSINDPQNLTLDEQRIMEALLWSYTEQLRATQMLAELGLLDEEEWRTRVQAESAFYLSNSYALAWWKNYSAESTALSDELISAINERVAQVDSDFTSQYFEKVQNNIHEAAAEKND